MIEDPAPTSTETIHVGSHGLDTLDTAALVATIINENRVAQQAVEHAGSAIAAAVDMIAQRLQRGARWHYIGAGSSGRLGMLDAAEIPPTFGTSPSLMQAHMAGGFAALTRAVEGAEDDALAGEREIRRVVKGGDVVVGISASGGAPYVVAGIRAARELGALTIGMYNNAQAELSSIVDHAILLQTGPEVLAGSTRLKAGTAQKIALNALSTATMVRLGKVYDNLMVDVVATNEKLRRRAVRLVQGLVCLNDKAASALLEQAGGSVKVAVVIGRRGVDAQTARALLDREAGFLRAVIGEV